MPELVYHPCLDPLFERLDCPREASLEEIDRAFVRLAVPAANEPVVDMDGLIEAYSVLADREARAQLVDEAKREQLRRRVRRVAVRSAYVIVAGLVAGLLVVPVAYPKVPSVVGMPKSDVADAFKNAGIETTQTLQHSDVAAGMAASSTPAAGARVWRFGKQVVQVAVSLGPTGTAHPRGYAGLAEPSTTACVGACHAAKDCRSCHDRERISKPKTHNRYWLGKKNVHAFRSSRYQMECQICHVGGETKDGRFCAGCHRRQKLVASSVPKRKPARKPTPVQRAPKPQQPRPAAPSAPPPPPPAPSW